MGALLVKSWLPGKIAVVLAAGLCPGSGCEGRGGDVFLPITPSSSECAGESAFPFVVDSSQRLARVRPEPPGLVEIGQLACPSRRSCPPTVGSVDPVPSVPVSLAIDRAGFGWLLYCSGELFKIDLKTAACSATTFDGTSQGFERFAMAFVQDPAGQALFVAGGIVGLQTSLGPVEPASSSLGRVQFPGWDISRVGAVAGWPALTGTPDGQLWGMFPLPTSGSPRLAQIDTGSGMETRTIGLPADALATRGNMAFVFWGDDFWIFRDVSDVRRISRATGQQDSLALASDSSRELVAAGVAICAPVKKP